MNEEKNEKAGFRDSGEFFSAILHAQNEDSGVDPRLEALEDDDHREMVARWNRAVKKNRQTP